jgi:hypothetical protein
LTLWIRGHGFAAFEAVTGRNDEQTVNQAAPRKKKELVHFFILSICTIFVTLIKMN